MTITDRQRLEQIVGRFRGRSILVVGDLILDRFVWGSVNRISPEAPVPVVEIQEESIRLGGAANVASNLASLGARPLLVGIVGRDEEGRKLIDELGQLGIGRQGILEDEARRTSVKTRIIAHNQQVCRTDRESRKAPSKAVVERILAAYGTFLDGAEGIILSDYAKGMMSPPLVATVIGESRNHGKFLAVDPKSADFSAYSRASIVTPNKREAERASGVQIVDEASLVSAGRKLIEATSGDYLLVTRGEAGMTLFDGTGHTHIPTAAREVFDVTGAGDTVISSLALAVAAGGSVSEASVLANYAAGVVVAKVGTATATADEILDSMARTEDD